jgi:hypothetical protein
MLRIPAPVLAIPGRNSDATQELVFEAKDIPALGFASFHVTKTSQASPPPISVADTFVINNGVRKKFKFRVLLLYIVEFIEIRGVIQC